MKIDDTIFIIIADVLNEMIHRSNHSDAKQRGLLIDQPVENGNVQIVNSSLPKVAQYKTPSAK